MRSPYGCLFDALCVCAHTPGSGKVISAEEKNALLPDLSQSECAGSVFLVQSQAIKEQLLRLVKA